MQLLGTLCAAIAPTNPCATIVMKQKIKPSRSDRLGFFVSWRRGEWQFTPTRSLKLYREAPKATVDPVTIEWAVCCSNPGGRPIEYSRKSSTDDRARDWFTLKGNTEISWSASTPVFGLSHFKLDIKFEHSSWVIEVKLGNCPSEGLALVEFDKAQSNAREVWFFPMTVAKRV